MQLRVGTATDEQLDDHEIRRWKYGPFRLELFDFHLEHFCPQTPLSYRFFCNEKLIFEGDDFGCSPCHSIDGDECVAALLSFLALRKGDTDKEYFDNYTPAQLEFSEQFGEELAMLAYELEHQEENEDEVQT